MGITQQTAEQAVAKLEEEYIRLSLHYEYLQEQQKQGAFVNDLIYSTVGQLRIIPSTVAILKASDPVTETCRLDKEVEHHRHEPQPLTSHLSESQPLYA